MQEEMQKKGYEFTEVGNTTEIYHYGNFTAAIFERKKPVNNPREYGRVPDGSIWANMLVASFAM